MNGVVAAVAIDLVVARLTKQQVWPVAAANRVVTRAAMDHVAKAVSVHDIVPAAAPQRVRFAAAIHRVGAWAAGDHVGSILAGDVVMPIAAVDLIVAVVAVEIVIAVIAVDDVVAVLATDSILAVTAVDPVVAVACQQYVVSATTPDYIVATESTNRVVTTECINGLRPTCTQNHVVAGGGGGCHTPEDGHDLAITQRRQIREVALALATRAVVVSVEIVDVLADNPNGHTDLTTVQICCTDRQTGQIVRVTLEVRRCRQRHFGHVTILAIGDGVEEGRFAGKGHQRDEFDRLPVGRDADGPGKQRKTAAWPRRW